MRSNPNAVEQSKSSHVTHKPNKTKQPAKKTASKEADIEPEISAEAEKKRKGRKRKVSSSDSDSDDEIIVSFLSFS